MFLWVPSFLQNFRSPKLFFFIIFLNTKIPINRSKFTPKSLHFLCEFLVPAKLPAKFPHSSITCEPPPLSQYVCTSVRTSLSKIVFFWYWWFYQHWLQYLVSPVFRFFSASQIFLFFKDIFSKFMVFKENLIFSSFWKCKN